MANVLGQNIYRKNFLEIACFKIFLTFPLNFLRILEYIQISSKLTNPFFLKLFPMLGKILPHTFMKLSVPKFAESLLLKLLNTYFLKLFSYTAPLPRHHVAVPSPITLNAGEWRTPRLRHAAPISVILHTTTSPSCWTTIYFRCICIFCNTPVFWSGILCCDFKDVSHQKIFNGIINIRSIVSKIQEDVSGINQRISQLEIENKRISGDVKRLHDARAGLEERIEDLEKYSCKNNALGGIPHAKGEQIHKIVYSIAKEWN